MRISLVDEVLCIINDDEWQLHMDKKDSDKYSIFYFDAETLKRNCDKKLEKEKVYRAQMKKAKTEFEKFQKGKEMSLSLINEEHVKDATFEDYVFYLSIKDSPFVLIVIYGVKERYTDLFGFVIPGKKGEMVIFSPTEELNEVFYEKMSKIIKKESKQRLRLLFNKK